MAAKVEKLCYTCAFKNSGPLIHLHLHYFVMIHSLLQKLRSVYKFASPRYQTVHLEYPVAVKPRWEGGHPQLLPIINHHRAAYKELLTQGLQYLPIFEIIQKQTPTNISENEPQWNNGFLPGLDIVNLYTILALKQPRQYIEIGSGNSTKVARKAVTDQKLKTQITSIDPYPRAAIDHLADRVLRQPFENLSDHKWIVETLEENDVLFIDNSHRVFANSDAMICLLELLPQLKAGVLVHIHDIYLPYDYPQFMCDRFYNEQYLLAALVMSNPMRYKPFMPNYFVSEDPELSAVFAPLWQHPNLSSVEQHGGSFWLQIGV